MARKYDPDFLLFLKDSPLCTKPDNLPAVEEWMGSPAEQQARPQYQQTRSNQGSAFGAFEKPRHGDNPLLDQTNRRPDLNRHTSRSSGNNPEDLVFGPPRMAFASSGRNKTAENDKSTRDADPQGRFSNLRNKSGDFEGDRFRDGRNANPLRRRGDAGDQEGEAWSTVKPRKSFGAEGAERFHGRMGGNFRDEKRAPRDRDDRSGRPFDGLTPHRDGDDEGRPRNNGLTKGKQDPWHRGEGNEARVPEKRERIDRAKSWRDRNPEKDPVDEPPARSHDNRRWGREQQQQGRFEREPEWLDEPVESKSETKTAQDFQKWMEEMKKSKDGGAGATKTTTLPVPEPASESVKPPLRSPAIETGPDKFFLAFGSTPTGETTTPGEVKDTAKPKAAGKSSRFTSFFQSQDGGRSESTAAPAAAVPPPNGLGPLGPLTAPAAAPGGQGQPPDEERQAFQQLLAKLQKQSVSQTPPGPSPYPPPGMSNAGEPGYTAGQSPFQAMLGERQDGPMGRPPPATHQTQEIHAPRPQPQARPEQLLQDLVGHHQRVSSQGSASARVDSNPRNNSNTEFLMNLMRAGPETQRSDSAMMRAAQHAQKQMMPQPNEREGDFPQEGRNSQRQQMRPPPPPGFPIDDGYRGGEADFRGNQPTQILQRPPPPPGLDQMPPGWMGGGQMPPPPPQQQQQQQGQQQGQQQQQRGPMLPPPGLAGGPGRNGPMPPHMFPPNMPPMPPPEAMGNMPPRNMGPPPPGFFNGPPHGFMPPGMGGFNGPPGPEAPFAGGPFEGRNMPPPAGGRGANFGRG